MAKSSAASAANCVSCAVRKFPASIVSEVVFNISAEPSALMSIIASKTAMSAIPSSARRGLPPWMRTPIQSAKERQVSGCNLETNFPVREKSMGVSGCASVHEEGTGRPPECRDRRLNPDRDPNRTNTQKICIVTSGVDVIRTPEGAVTELGGSERHQTASAGGLAEPRHVKIRCRIEREQAVLTRKKRQLLDVRSGRARTIGRPRPDRICERLREGGRPTIAKVLEPQADDVIGNRNARVPCSVVPHQLKCLAWRMRPEVVGSLNHLCDLRPRGKRCAHNASRAIDAEGPGISSHGRDGKSVVAPEPS